MAPTIGITVVAIVVMGCTLGSMLPLLLRRLGLDPATSSTPFIATLIDVFGIVLYFTVANLLLRHHRCVLTRADQRARGESSCRKD